MITLGVVETQSLLNVKAEIDSLWILEESKEMGQCRKMVLRLNKINCVDRIGLRGQMATSCSYLLRSMGEAEENYIWTGTWTGNILRDVHQMWANVTGLDQVPLSAWTSWGEGPVLMLYGCVTMRCEKSGLKQKIM